ncbi:protein kinase domain-containing protein [[Limnothrix rosea] IAM M-220]|uniref:protein kinase domain-containing protein n=1 Tax=[Limnothrix rosea] IAM M-220 TaxID=454133 RepID=UPI000960E40A|nr:bifunctional serine/threonine protein kinase/MFS transporter [[Limnothrix rosea] IAM M-220]OKH18090.1 serine/threonine protein kinase [[Limnothrix rosea] IAM M-220]
MEILCTRPNCGSPQNQFSDLDDPTHLKTTQQKYCTSCGMHLILGGRYLVEKLLGQGGFGAAYLARDRYTPTMRKCVVKQFQPIGNLDDEQLALAQGLFEREAHVLERIGNRHKQIPDLLAFFPLIVPTAHGTGNDQYFYLVQEYIEGEDLEQELERKGKFSEAEVQSILISMLGVLDFVHTEGTIHRDIKPSNIMRRKDGLFYLLDFGAVKEVTIGVAAKTPSQRSTGIYSPGYAPPEQMRGAQVFPATDLYALAVTCIVLLTNESPKTLFDAYSNSWQWQKFVRVSPLLAALLDQMLQSVPGDRPATAKAVLDALRPAPSAPSPTSYQGTQIQSKAIAPNPSPTPKHKPQPTQTPRARPAKKPAPPSSQKQPDNEGSIVNSLVGAAFVGLEGTFLYFATMGFVGGSLGIGLWGAIMGGLIFGIVRKVISGGWMPVLGILSAGVGGIAAQSTFGMSFFPVLFFAVIAAAGVTFVFVIFTVVYRLLQNIL